MVNKHLKDAVSYINTNYDISVDESHSDLSTVIERYVVTLDSLQLETYWLRYQQEIEFSRSA